MSTPIAIAITKGQQITYALDYPFGATGASWNWSGSLPSGMYLSYNDSARNIQFTGTANALAGEYILSVQTWVSGSLHDDWVVTITIADPTSADAPVISCADATSGSPNTLALTAGTVGIQFAATNGGTNWSGSLPYGLSLTTASGLVSGTLGIGTYWLTVSASNSAYSGGPTQTASYVLQLDVTAAIPVVSLASGASLNGTVGTALNVQFNAQTDAGTVAWSATGLPTGLTLNPSTGLLTGTPAVSGTTTATITATNAAGAGNYSAALVIAASGSTPSFGFLVDDPTLTGLQIDIRTGAATLSRTTPFKQGEAVRLAAVFLDSGAPVTPPTVAGLKMGVRPNNQWGADAIFQLATWTLVEAAGANPAYALAEFTADNDALARELAALIDASTASLDLMADMLWLGDEGRRFSQTFTFSVAPAVTY